MSGYVNGRFVPSGEDLEIARELMRDIRASARSDLGNEPKLRPLATLLHNVCDATELPAAPATAPTPTEE